MANRSTYGKSSSRARRPGGLYHAKVTRVIGVDVYVEVPRLTLDFEHGPIPYSGPVPVAGDEVYVGFLEGSQDDVVGIFSASGGGGGGSSGPIEPTFFVASTTARQALKDVADYVDGVQTEPITDSLAALPAGGGKVQLSEGRFVLPQPACGNVNGLIDIPANSTLEGVGNSTIIEISGNTPFSWEYGIYMYANTELKNLRIDFTNNLVAKMYAAYMAASGSTISNVTFEGMDLAAQADLFYCNVDYGSKVIDCIFKDLSDQLGGT